ncbi:MAG: rcc01693 family protein [Pseudomonadota bacterium]
MAEPINWAALMRHGMGALRLSPEAFWDMTPAELRLALEGAGLLSGDAPMDREWLTSLMSTHPDNPE